MLERLYDMTGWLSKLTGIRGDYILHFGVCSFSTYLIGILSFLIVNVLFGPIPAVVASLFGAVFALGLGIGKEMGDKNNPNSGWSWGDLVADGLGIVVGTTLLAITVVAVLFIYEFNFENLKIFSF